MLLYVYVGRVLYGGLLGLSGSFLDDWDTAG